MAGNAAKGDVLGALSRNTFVWPCSSLIVQAATITHVRNLWRSKPLRYADARILRRRFGSLVDRVTIYWNADLINDWEIGYTRVHLGMDIAGQAFGSRIYITDPYKPGDAQQLETLFHEFAHAEQAANLGGLGPFAWSYCEAFYDSNFVYYNNDLEVQARATAAQLIDP